MKPTVIALGGNPNAGKTTLFNALTGSRQRVGNYPGVTVEKREGDVLHGETRIRVVDLPGTYSLTSWSDEERVARNVLVQERPSAVIDVVDATNLDRNLYLAVQFLELGVPLVLALNMMDEVQKQGRRINTPQLSHLLGVPVVETVARRGEGKEALLDAAVQLAGKRKGNWQPLEISYGPDVDPVLKKMTEILETQTRLKDLYPCRWLALRYIEGDPEIRSLCDTSQELASKLQGITASLDDHCQKTLRTHADSIIAGYRYGFITSITREVVQRGEDSMENRLRTSEKIDRVLTHQLGGPLIMLMVFYLLFEATFAIGEIPMGWVEALFGWMGDMASALISPGLLQSLIVSGIIDGVGAVMGFVPLILVMFLLVTFLEDAGYMARMAYMLDRIFRIFGLHGASVMPFVISGGIPGGCAVPGVMAARTLRSPKERLATLLTAPFMSCGAKVPVFLLLSAAFFGDYAAQAMFWITLSSWAAALLVARLLRSTLIRGEATPFVMELPPYRMPTLHGVLLHTWERAWQYIKKAGTVILAIAILIWVSMTFPGLPENRTEAFERERMAVVGLPDSEAQLLLIDNAEGQAALRHSLAGRVGTALEPISSLAGFDWKTNIALIGGFAAKEVIIATMGTAYSMGEVDPEDSQGLAQRLASDPSWTVATAIALIAFVMLYSPCFVTIVAIAKESSWKWATFSMVFNTALAFAASVFLFQIFSRMI
ncbi:ferrous iron transport protein B [Desulfobotulus sp. H1]|uniref:Ferrous iron transport protein B n=1 Tax=Desulfobotulus pelophilus TaxID=2823377 RepID=A0ABT3N7X4_9BACT|nr:ferrous iron transport protein B [Desulfobotulus pelophilus]MCW7753555.1 ferrous iron transport protein B [Desulfobotulus pelophilus]